MAQLKIYRGTHQIGGCCTEISSGGERILLDLGANLPDTDPPIRDEELISMVFDGRPTAGLLFSHPHGDHYGLYKKVPKNVPMYIGPMAKDILKILVSRLDYLSPDKGLPAVERMLSYQPGKELRAFRNIQVLPFYVDHSAPDAYMFYIQTAGKKILFSGDFREHGILGERDRLWRAVKKFVPKGIDLLITEGTLISRNAQRSAHPVQTEAELGRRAQEVFRRRRYNFVLVSSTNLDSIMEFYHHTPKGMPFVCDVYQAEIMLTAMLGMAPRGNYPQYQRSEDHPVLHVLYPGRRLSHLRALGARLKRPLQIEAASPELLRQKGFVMPVRKNTKPRGKTIFDEMRDEYYPQGGQIIYSMWDGYLKPDHADKALLNYIDGRPVIPLHTSGHAYAETIAKLIDTVDPKVIVPMHTQRPEDFCSLPALAPYRSRVRPLTDGKVLSLDTL